MPAHSSHEQNLNETLLTGPRAAHGTHGLTATVSDLLVTDPNQSKIQSKGV